MSRVAIYCGVRRCVSAHMDAGLAYVLPTSTPNIAGFQKLPDDAIGVFTLQLTNLVVGSSVQVETTSGTPLYNATVAATEHSAIFDVYSAGSPLNNLRVKVRKGSSAPYYQAWETLVVSSVGSQTVYVSQIPD